MFSLLATSRFFIIVVMSSLFICVSSSAFEMPPVVVKVEAAKVAENKQIIDSIGSLIAERDVLIKPGISGRIEEVKFKDGDHVVAGQLLIALSHDSLSAQLAALTAEFVLTKLMYQRTVRLFSKQAVSKSELDQAKAALDSACAKVNQVKSELSKKSVKAPFSGRVGIRQVNLGDFVSAGTSLVSLVSLDPIIAEFTVPEAAVKQIHLNDKVRVKSNVNQKQVFWGRIVSFSPHLDPDTRSLTVRAVVSNSQQLLVPGASIEVGVYVHSGKSRQVKVNSNALFVSPQGNFVYLQKKNKAVKTPVVIAKRGDDFTWLSQGVVAGDKVIVQGKTKLYPGAKIIVTP